MKAKEKAQQLLTKLTSGEHVSTEAARCCALICVNEILSNSGGKGSTGIECENDEIYCDSEYWSEVFKHLQEI